MDVPMTAPEREVSKHKRIEAAVAVDPVDAAAEAGLCLASGKNRRTA